MNNEPPKSIQDSILASIKTGRVQMRPRWQFVLKTSLMAMGLVLVALALLFVGSFIVFILEQNGAWFAPAFGQSGVKELFMALPLVFVGVALVFIILLQILVRRYAFSYARPVLYSLVGITTLVVLGSFLIAQSHFHEDLFKQARDERLPIVGGFYRQFGTPHIDRVISGIIIEQIDNGFSIEDSENQLFTVVITPETQFPNGMQFDIGDNIIVLGDRSGMVIEADGIRKIEGREDLFPDRQQPSN